MVDASGRSVNGEMTNADHPALASTTPTLAETMRTCLLWAGSFPVPGIAISMFLGTPKLGWERHTMKFWKPCLRWPLEAYRNCSVATGQKHAGTRPSHAWRRQPRAIRSTIDLAQESRGGDITLFLETLRLRVAELAGTCGAVEPSFTGESNPWAVREKEFSAFAGTCTGASTWFAETS